MRRMAAMMCMAALAGCDSGSTNTPADAAVTPSDLATGGGDMAMAPPPDQAMPRDMAVTGPAASAYAGFWQITALLLPNQPAVLTRTSVPARTLSDYTMTAMDATHLRVAGKLTVITDGVLQALGPVDIIIVLEGTSWIRSENGTVTVFKTALTGDDLKIDFDPQDVRNQGDNSGTPRQLVLRRMTPPPMLLVGNWKAFSITTNGTTVYGGACTALMNGSSRLDLAMTIDSHHVLSETLTQQNFSDQICVISTGPIMMQSIEGILEETAGAVESLTRPKGGGSGTDITWTLTAPAANQLKLTQKSCQPMANCAGSPSEVVLQRM